MSFDPVISALAAKRDALERQLSQLRQVLLTYARRVQPPEERPEISPLEHYALLDAPECGCTTCMDWEQRRAEFVEAATLVPKGHKWTICSCFYCRYVGRIQLNYLAASNRRDLLIEMSFHARYHSRIGGAVMGWFVAEMRRPEYTINWCAQEMSRFPVERWLRRCEMALAPQFSGTVWIDAAGVTELSVRIGSSLSSTVELLASA